MVSINSNCDFWGSDSDPTINELISAWRHGDREAGGKIYNKFKMLVTSSVKQCWNQRYRSRAGIEDIAQSTFLAVLTDLQNRTLEFANEATFAGWLRKAARNQAIKRIEYETAQRRSVEKDVQHSGFERDMEVECQSIKPLDRLEKAERVQAILDKLNDEQQKLVQMISYGYSQSEIGNQLNMSDRTVRRRWKEIRLIPLM